MISFVSMHGRQDRATGWLASMWVLFVLNRQARGPSFADNESAKGASVRVTDEKKVGTVCRNPASRDRATIYAYLMIVKRGGCLIVVRKNTRRILNITKVIIGCENFPKADRGCREYGSRFCARLLSMRGVSPIRAESFSPTCRTSAARPTERSDDRDATSKVFPVAARHGGCG